MSDPTENEVLSKPLKKLFSAMVGAVTVKEAALKIGMTPSTAYNLLYGLRKRYRKWRRGVNTVEAQKRRGALFKRVLTDRLSAGEEEVEEELEEW